MILRNLCKIYADRFVSICYLRTFMWFDINGFNVHLDKKLDQQRRLNARNSELERRNKELSQELDKKPSQVKLLKNEAMCWVMGS